MPERVLTTAIDVSHTEALRETAAKGAEKFGGIDFIVPCAGIMGEGDGMEVSDDNWQRAFTVNVTAAFTTVRESVQYSLPSPAAGVWQHIRIMPPQREPSSLLRKAWQHHWPPGSASMPLLPA
ncbi:SDR family oxidoreductase [Arthrobacter sp. ISL-5]|nr:SDR family oxidoreductase [Arthrobacter sp. ISL-5]